MYFGQRKTVYYQSGHKSPFHPTYTRNAGGGLAWLVPEGKPHMFGRGWRRFRKHRFDVGQ